MIVSLIRFLLTILQILAEVAAAASLLYPDKTRQGNNRI
jgi:hypothetical protein